MRTDIIIKSFYTFKFLFLPSKVIIICYIPDHYRLLPPPPEPHIVLHNNVLHYIDKYQQFRTVKINNVFHSVLPLVPK